MIKKIIFTIISLTCMLNPFLIYANNGAAVGVGAGLFGLGLGLAIAGSRKNPDVIYVQQPATTDTVDDTDESDDQTDYEDDDEQDDETEYDTDDNSYDNINDTEEVEVIEYE